MTRWVLRQAVHWLPALLQRKLDESARRRAQRRRERRLQLAAQRQAR